MVTSSAFSPDSAPILTKWDILMKFWEQEVPYLQARFGSDGRDPADPSFNGFGFVIEGLARQSPKLPRNTERGEVASQLIGSVLHYGGSDFVQQTERRANSDQIWLDYVGRRVTIRGIGEVKASFDSFKNRQWQLGRQEGAIRQFVRDLEMGKATHEFFKKRKLVVSEELQKLLIVPFGEGAKFNGHVSNGWKVVELEFSRNEALFISQQIWPDFRPDVRFKSGLLANFETVVEKFVSHLKPTLDELFVELKDRVPQRELSLFLLATGKLVMTEEAMNWVKSTVETCYWSAVQNCLDKPMKRDNLSQAESKHYDMFLYDLTDDQGSLLFFLNFVRCLSAEVIARVRKDHQVRYLQSLKSLDLLEIW